MRNSKAYNISRIIFLILFIICCVILIIEAATPGVDSANKSNVVSDTIMNVVNNISEAITKKPSINNVNEFRSFIRKLVGHYGAFLVMAIFASLTFFMFFNYKKQWVMIIKAASLILFGFLFAGLTELIQLGTPDRAGAISDVWIDFFGFMTSAGIIIIIFFVIFYYKNRTKIIEETEI